MFNFSNQSGDGNTSNSFPDGFDQTLAESWVKQARLAAGSAATDTDLDVEATEGGVCDCGRVSFWLQEHFKKEDIAGLEGAARQIGLPGTSHFVFIVSGKAKDDQKDKQSGTLQLGDAALPTANRIYTGEPQAILDGTAAQFTEFLNNARGTRNSNFGKKTLLSLDHLKQLGVLDCVRTGVFKSDQHSAFIAAVRPNLGLPY